MLESVRTKLVINWFTNRNSINNLDKNRKRVNLAHLKEALFHALDYYWQLLHWSCQFNMNSSPSIFLKISVISLHYFLTFIEMLSQYNVFLLFFLFSLGGLDTLISNITTLDRKFITMQLNKKDTHGKLELFFFFQVLGFNTWDSLRPGVLATVVVVLMKRW